MTQKSPSRHHCTTLLGCIFATKAYIDNRKKHLKQQYLLDDPHVLVIWRTWPTNGWDQFGSLGHTSKFQGVSRLGFITARSSLIAGQPNSARCLAISWASTLYIHFRGSCPLTNFASCKIRFASKSCVLLYWQRHCRALQQRTSAKLCGVGQEWNYGTFAEDATYIRQGGHHVGH